MAGGVVKEKKNVRRRIVDRPCWLLLLCWRQIQLYFHQFVIVFLLSLLSMSVGLLVAHPHYRITCRCTQFILWRRSQNNTHTHLYKNTHTHTYPLS